MLLATLVVVAQTNWCNGESHSKDGDKTDKGAKLGLPKTFNFGDFVRKFHKNYENLEMLNRANLFFSRTVQIFKHNAKFVAKQRGHYLNQNELIDLTPAEAKAKLAAHQSELGPVEEARQAPNMPADDYYQQTRDEFNDGLSQASATGAKPVATSGQLDSEVNFFSEPGREQNHGAEQVEPRTLVHNLVQDHELADKMAKLVELHNSRGNSLEDKLKLIRQARKISTNQNKPKDGNELYDNSLIPSQAAWGKPANTFSSTYADLMMQDFSTNLEPYPTPEIPSMPALPIAREPSSGMGGLMNLVRDIYGVFSAPEAGELKIESGTEEEEEEGELVEGLPSDGDAKIAAPSAKGQQAAGVEATPQLDLIKLGPVKYDIDWRRTGCVPGPKNQQSCNACYAFSLLDLMEFLYCQKHKSLMEFSTQYLIDCGHKAQLNGCRGGKLSNVGVFISRYGLQTSAMYPYAGVEQQCPFSEEDDAQRKSYQLKPAIRQWQLFEQISAWYEWLPKTPIIVGINMPADFLAYGGGIHDGQACVPDMVHAMMLVGSGVQDGKTFWLLKNTFSQTWGEGGYFRLSKRAPLNCFNSAMVAKVRF